MKLIAKLTTLTCALAVSALPAVSQKENTSKAPQQSHLTFLAAGVPKVFGENPNYQRIFHDLKSAGITVFMPFSEYQEVPESKALTYDREFYPQYKTNDTAITTMRENGVKLLVPASILYGEPNTKEEPLKKLLAWAGRNNVFGVYSYDEPALQTGDMSSNCKTLYARIKAVDPTLPVIMIHSSIPESAASELEIDAYLKKVKASSQYADIVGFDVYAIPADLMKVKGPYSGAEKILNYAEALPEYIRWLKQNLPNKKHMMVLQAFCAEDQGHPTLLAKMYGDRRPTKSELERMTEIVVSSNVSVGWWGQSLVKDRDARFWTQVLDATRRYARPK